MKSSAANLPGLRFHDLRHTCIIRIAATRKALDDLERAREEKRQHPVEGQPSDSVQ
jgi:integrase